MMINYNIKYSYPNNTPATITLTTPYIASVGETYVYSPKDNLPYYYCGGSIPQEIWICPHAELLIVGRTDYAPNFILNSLGNLYVLHKNRVLIFCDFESLIYSQKVRLIDNGK